jgi:hypothetical protein
MPREIRRPGKIGVAASLAALSLAVSASPAGAAVTIGQTAPPNPPLTCSGGLLVDSAQPTVTAGNSYVVPGNGTITSWSHNAYAGAGQTMKMKVWRHVSGQTYMAVGHDGPRDLIGGTLNTFTGIDVPVKAGDVLGLSVGVGGAANACSFSAPGGSVLGRMSDLADGQSGEFTSFANQRANIAAVFAPSNTFTLGKVKRNRKKGTATLTVEDVPNPGELVLSGKGLRKASTSGALVAKTVTAPGDVTLKVRAKGKKKRKLNESGKVRVKANVTFTPTGGDPRTQSRKLMLKKR